MLELVNLNEYFVIEETQAFWWLSEYSAENMIK